MSNLPMGAEDDPTAPFNRETKKVKFIYSITSSDEVEVDKECSESTINDIVVSMIKNKHGNVAVDFLEIDY